MTMTSMAGPHPVNVGPEMDALARFYPDVTWTGTIVAGGMGPGTPAMRVEGRGTHRRIQDGRWIVGTYRQEQYLDNGSLVSTWKLHWVVGWDPAHSDYRATMADSYGHADMMRGHLDGRRLAFETLRDAAVRTRMTWEIVAPFDIMWSTETSIDGSPWMPTANYHLSADVQDWVVP